MRNIISLVSDIGNDNYDHNMDEWLLFKQVFRGHYVIKVESFYPQLIPLPDWIEKRKIIQYTFEEISCHHIIQDNTEVAIQPYKINKLKAKAFLTKNIQLVKKVGKWKWIMQAYASFFNLYCTVYF